MRPAAPAVVGLAVPFYHAGRDRGMTERIDAGTLALIVGARGFM